LKRFKVFVFSLFLFACSEQNIAPPVCRVTPQAASNLMGEGACVIKINKQLLVLQRASGKYDLPFSPNISDTSAQCAAHQGAWLETGFNVEVGKKLATQRNGVSLFACHLNVGFDGSEESIPPPPWKPADVVDMQFIYPFDIDLHQWHRPDQFIAVMDAYSTHVVNLAQIEEKSDE
jgi:hypothetical protein